ncbi:MAG: hypothetical protein SFT91_00395, partial [Rickettsiaceae bacterium]|nr:hypothetical protein [Rickettsiaceae bacterium]
DSTEWLMIVDTDEFFFSVGEKNLAETLRDYDDYAAVSGNWILFTSNQVEKIPDRDLMIDRLVQYVSNDDLHVKTIVKPRYVKYISHPHYPNLLKGFAQVDENKQYFRGPFLPSPSHKIFRVNHYVTRDLDFYRNQKLLRVHMRGGNNDLDDMYLDEKIKEYNVYCKKLPTENVDYSISKFSQPIKELLGYIHN